nr:hypothetical protein [Tanacetum cinerariifolium]
PLHTTSFTTISAANTTPLPPHHKPRSQHCGVPTMAAAAATPTGTLITTYAAATTAGSPPAAGISMSSMALGNLMKPYSIVLYQFQRPGIDVKEPITNFVIDSLWSINEDDFMG